MNLKQSAMIVGTAVAATVASLLSGMGILAIRNRFFPSASPKVQVDLVTPLVNSGKVLSKGDVEGVLKNCTTLFFKAKPIVDAIGSGDREQIVKTGLFTQEEADALFPQPQQEDKDL